MAKAWMNFASVKEQASFSAVLDHYRINHPPQAIQANVLCPFHDDTEPSLSVNFEEKLFNCFSCGEAGDILSFVAKMENASIPEAARIMTDLCGVTVPQQKTDVRRDGKRAGEHGGEEGNKPLGFTLDLDPTHPYLGGRGLSQETIKRFGLGFCAHGLMKDRIGIPIHDEHGTLIAYAGRWVSDEVPDGVPKYLLPRGFKKSDVLFNLNRIASADHVILVEGYWSVFRLHALGISAVALMGRTLSKEQEELLACSSARFMTLLLDGDEAGRAAAQALLPTVTRNWFVYHAELPDGQQPDTVDEEELRKLLWASGLR